MVRGANYQPAPAFSPREHSHETQTGAGHVAPVIPGNPSRELSHELAKDVQVGQSQSFSGGTSRQASEDFMPPHGPSPTGHMSFNFFGSANSHACPPIAMGAQVAPC